MIVLYNLANLRALRKNLGLTQKQLAEYLNIEERQYRRYESTDSDIPMSKAVMLANYFHVSVDYLIGRKSD